MKQYYLIISLISCILFTACKTDGRSERKKGDDSKIVNTKIEFSESSIEVNNLAMNKVSHIEFSLKNVGKKPLLIQNVKASCGCAVPSWDKNPIEPGSETYIRVEVKPNSPGVFRKKVTVFCNIEEYYQSLFITGIVN